jgi:hypothetical protein
MLLETILERKRQKLEELFLELNEAANLLLEAEIALTPLEEDFALTLLRAMAVDKEVVKPYLDYVYHEIHNGEIYMSVYTPEETQYLIERYNSAPSRETVRLLAEEMKKTEKSVIGKLSREGVYQRETYKNKRGEDPVTKLEIVSDIATVLGLESEKLEGLDKAPKNVLALLYTTLAI